MARLPTLAITASDAPGTVSMSISLKGDAVLGEEALGLAAVAAPGGGVKWSSPYLYFSGCRPESNGSRFRVRRGLRRRPPHRRRELMPSRRICTLLVALYQREGRCRRGGRSGWRFRSRRDGLLRRCRLCLVVSTPAKSFRDDRRGVFGARVVAGEYDEVAAFSRGAAHHRALGLVAVATAAEEGDDASIGGT